MNSSISREPRAERGCGWLSLAGGRSLSPEQVPGEDRAGRYLLYVAADPRLLVRQVKWFVKHCRFLSLSLSHSLLFKALFFKLSDSNESNFRMFPLLHQCKERCSKTSALPTKSTEQKLCFPSDVIVPFSLQTFWDQHTRLLSVQH